MEWIETASRRHALTIPAVVQTAAERAARIDRSLTAAAQALESLQQPLGCWWGDLTADTTLESDYILYRLWRHQPDEDGEWRPPAAERIRKGCQSILRRQLPDGGWNIYPGGPSEINATARAYTACKLAGRVAGIDPESALMRRARDRVIALGGLQAANSYTKINFSLLGLYPRRWAPSIPPEIVLAPGDILYEMSSWTRAILVPLSIVQAIAKPKVTPHGMGVGELLRPTTRYSLPKRDAAALIFHQVDRAVKLWEKRGLKNVRARAIREAERWMLERTRHSDGLGAIYPSMMYCIMALESLGYPEDQPDLIEAIRHFDNLILEDEDNFQFQPAVSPLWDTAICSYALGHLQEVRAGTEAWAPSPAVLTRAADWMLTKETRRKGDWAIKRPDLMPSGWAFEFNNEYYPDVDDTAMVLLALGHAKASDAEAQARVERRATDWILGMQCSDGGWAAFDADNDWQILNKVPFADHNAMLDPACPDITGRVIDALVKRGLPADHAAIERGVQFLLHAQERDGSWYGRWGVNYIYGTFLALRALRVAGGAQAQPAIENAAAWIRSVANRDGGWGESCQSYRDNRFVAAPSTASQTAWAVLGLAAAGDTTSSAAERGVTYLLDTQQPNGRWKEDLATGTGFPNVFYLTYHLYRDYFPLLALATVRGSGAAQRKTP
ncbi:MAG: squalene--hopene cyclase [Bryobacteraceae bacterium]